MEFNRRNHQKTAIERIERFTQSEEFQAADLVALQDRRQLLEQAYRNFENEHLALIEENVQPEDLDVQEQLAAQVETTFLTALGRLRTKIHDLTVQLRANESGQNDTNDQPPPQINGDLRLERISISQFTGDYAQWSEWKAMYDSLVHNVTTLSDTQKFHYLKHSVGGSAEQVLRGWQILGPNYQAAYESLVNIYENKYRIIIAHLEELTNMPKLQTETHEGLRTLVDTTNRVLRQLASPAIAAPTEHWDYFVVHLLLVRCPPRTLNAWETYHRTMQMPTLEELTTFLNQRAMSLLTINPSISNTNGAQKSKSDTNNNKSKQSNQKSEKSATQNGGQQKSLQCHHCKQPHAMYRCLSFLQMSVSDRKKRVRELNLCDNCFMPGHKAGTSQCRFSVCKRCNRNQYHNSLLCDKPSPSVAVNQLAIESSDSNGNAAGASSSGSKQQDFY